VRGRKEREGSTTRTVSAIRESKKGEARSARSLSFCRRSVDIISTIRQEEGKKQEARRNGLISGGDSGPPRSAVLGGPEDERFRWIPRRAIERGKGE
jgi:hypothetical protein